MQGLHAPFGLHARPAGHNIRWRVAQFPTPCLRINLAIARRNIRRLAEYAGRHGLKLRPHTKTHKSLEMSRLQVEAGAAGLTVAKAGEAEIISGACPDILVGYPAADESRAARLAQLARSKSVRVAVDTRAAADAIACAAREAGSTIGLLVDIDVGYHRTGVQSPADAVALAQYVDSCRGVRLDGIFLYPGDVRTPPGEQVQPMTAIGTVLGETLELWKSRGLAAPIVSGGSTPTAYQSHLVRQLTEIRPGTYIYNDMNTVWGGFASLDDCAAAVECTVVSDAVPGKVVMDAGSKTLGSDFNVIRPDGGFGHIPEFPEAKIVRLTEEHGEIDVSRCPIRPKIGRRLRVIPNHICPCVNLHDFAILDLEDGQSRQLRIDARGKVS